MRISSKMKSILCMVMILVAFVDAQCIGVYNATQLRDAIATANEYSVISPTVITLCSDFALGSESVTSTGQTNNTIFDLSNRNIRLKCEKASTDSAFATGQPRCVFDAQFSNKTIFAGVRTKIFVVGANFINAGYNPENYIESGATGAWAFENSTVIVQECSFLNNIGETGGAINLIGSKSVLRLRSGTRLSPMIFSNNTASSLGGAISFRGKLFHVQGRHTQFTNNYASYAGGAIMQSPVGLPTDTTINVTANISGVSFVNNYAGYEVRVSIF
jgi:predicted outer membrane repeat protein